MAETNNKPTATEEQLLYAGLLNKGMALGRTSPTTSSGETRRPASRASNEMPGECAGTTQALRSANWEDRGTNTSPPRIDSSPALRESSTW